MFQPFEHGFMTEWYGYIWVFHYGNRVALSFNAADLVLLEQAPTVSNPPPVTFSPSVILANCGATAVRLFKTSAGRLRRLCITWREEPPHWVHGT